MAYECIFALSVYPALGPISEEIAAPSASAFTGYPFPV